MTLWKTSKRNGSWLNPLSKLRDGHKKRMGRRRKRWSSKLYPCFAKKCIPITRPVMEPFKEKEVKTSMDRTRQVLNLVKPVVKYLWARTSTSAKVAWNNSRLLRHYEGYHHSKWRGVWKEILQSSRESYSERLAQTRPRFIDNVRSRTTETTQEEVDGDILRGTGELESYLKSTKGWKDPYQDRHEDLEWISTL